jgi:hypothetical protein
MEQGIFLIEQGIFRRDQGIFGRGCGALALSNVRPNFNKQTSRGATRKGYYAAAPAALSI